MVLSALNILSNLILVTIQEGVYFGKKTEFLYPSKLPKSEAQLQPRGA